MQIVTSCGLVDRHVFQQKKAHTCTAEIVDTTAISYDAMLQKAAILFNWTALQRERETGK